MIKTLFSKFVSALSLAAMVSAGMSALPVRANDNVFSDPDKFSQWEVVGPTGGDVRVVTIDPRDKDRLYLSTLDGQIHTSADGGKTFSTPIAFGNKAHQPGHADILSLGSLVWLTWKEFDGEQSVIYTMLSRDGGAKWDVPHKLAATADASDHPLLVQRAGRTFVSWNTAQDGYRLIRLEDTK